LRQKDVGQISPFFIKSSLARRNLQKFFSNRLALTGMTVVLLFVLGAVFAPLLTKYSPSYVDMTIRYQPLSAKHWLGTDSLGRDILTRLLYEDISLCRPNIGSVLTAWGAIY